MKRFITNCVVIMIVTVAIGFACKTTYKDSGLLEADSVQDLYQRDCEVKTSVMVPEQATYDDDLKSYMEQIWEPAGSYNDMIHAIVKASGKLYIESNDICQEFEIIKVIDGDKSYEGKKAYCSSMKSITEGGRLTLSNDISDVTYLSCGTNLMEKDNYYLISMYNNSIAKKMKVPYFVTERQLSYFNLSKNDSLEDMVKGIPKKLEDYAGREFLVTNKNELSYLLDLKAKILEMAGKDIQPYLGY